MSDSRCFRCLAVAAAFGLLVLPMHASAFWIGPGCMLSDMFGLGTASGSIAFSFGGGGHGRSHGAGYPYYPIPAHGAPYAAPYALPPRSHRPDSRSGLTPTSPETRVRTVNRNAWRLDCCD